MSKEAPIIVLTGASSGIGAVAAMALADQGAHLAVVGRNAERTRAMASRIGGEAYLADFDHLDDVHALAEALLTRYNRIDVLANNAGGLVSKRALTVDGHERTIQSNHLAPFLLTNLLLPRLIDSAADAPVRVVSTASMANLLARLRLDDLDWQTRPWLGGWGAYGASKLADLLFIRELAERTTGTGIRAYSFHPGTVVTGFGATSPLIKLGHLATGSRYGIRPEQGAVPLIALAGGTLTGNAPIGAPTGTYFDKLTPGGRVNAQARDPQVARDLWAVSARAVGLKQD
ncbi:SDR family NAD(P)-dependent oxidoreductase [Rathayibacter soli]|uniref:SDR family NAD(P)-dependent oxidoreductase n=1 Tax=Rathayibacter soli TaxID=3144168 RepID=UPI0027E524CB|nr:SDR family NAD(P)-dependent oxidoreductase [Glaciibacter superstes]